MIISENPGSALTFEDIFHRRGVGEYLDDMFGRLSQVHLRDCNLVFKSNKW